MNWSEIWSWIEKNRFTVIAPVIGTVIWLVAVGCTPVTESPFVPGKEVTATQLEQDYLIWQKENEIVMQKFENAGKDLEQQKANQAAYIGVITTLASGGVADWPGLIQLLLGSGLVGLIGDNIRKNGVIGGLKRNA
jgi:hypothetical protein